MLCLPLYPHPWLFLSFPDCLTPKIPFLFYVPSAPLPSLIYLHSHQDLSMLRFVCVCVIASVNNSTYAP